MGAGGSRNYAQSALDTLALERLKAQTPIQQTETDDVLKRYTEGTGAIPQSRDITTGLAALQERIDAERAKLPELTITTTEQKTRPAYSMSVVPGPYEQAKPSQTVYELPEGAVLQQGAYGDTFYIAPSSGDPRNNPENYGRTQYRRQGNQKYTVTNTRAAEAGDDIYDKQMNLINQLQRQFDVRDKYKSPSATGIQGLIAEPVVTQPQTGYNINNILKRYIG
tara:strand:- start:40 stop:708 length:669 start_codon:yes stop_codon:yes gene_type:complete